MTDWSDLEAEARKRTREVGPRCAIEVFLKGVSPDWRRELGLIIMDRSQTTVGIHRALLARVGFAAPSVWSIGNHRNRKCRCHR